MSTTVRTMTPIGVIDPKNRSYNLSARDAVMVAYIHDVYGAAELVPANQIQNLHHEEARTLVQESHTKPGVFHIILTDGRAWFGFPNNELL